MYSSMYKLYDIMYTYIYSVRRQIRSLVSKYFNSLEHQTSNQKFYDRYLTILSLVSSDNAFTQIIMIN